MLMNLNHNFCWIPVVRDTARISIWQVPHGDTGGDGVLNLSSPSASSYSLTSPWVPRLQPQVKSNAFFKVPTKMTPLHTFITVLYREPSALTYAIKRSCENKANKAEVVAQDEKESDLWATLDLDLEPLAHLEHELVDCCDKSKGWEWAGRRLEFVCSVIVLSRIFFLF